MAFIEKLQFTLNRLARIQEDKNVILSDEHQDFKWLNLEDAITFAEYSDMQETLKSVDKFLNNKPI